MRQARSAWLHSPLFDSAWILLPAWAIGTLLLAVPSLRSAGREVSPLLWLVLIVGIDVAHVYATLFRTYFDRHELRVRRGLYLGAPLLAYVAGVVLYGIKPSWFWSALAYAAAFHFVRQQYGLMMIYRRIDSDLPRWTLRLDQAVAYAATVYPLIWWHAHLPREYVWFVPGDFIAIPAWVDAYANRLYIALLVAWLIQQWWLATRRRMNLPKTLLIGGTVVSWYAGVILTDGDLGFTVANVVAHGVPYIALSWLYGSNERMRKVPSKAIFAVGALPLFAFVLVGLAWLEEGLWDGLVWREHGMFFGWSDWLPVVHSGEWLAVVIPLLALPQATHYILDGFIWRLRDNRYWRDVLLYRADQQGAGT